MFIVVRQFRLFAAIECVSRIAVFAGGFGIRVAFPERLRTPLLATLDNRISLRIQSLLATSATTATSTAATSATRTALASVRTHIARLTRATDFLRRPIESRFIERRFVHGRSILDWTIDDRAIHRHISRRIQRRTHRRPTLLWPGRTSAILSIERSAIIRATIRRAPIARVPTARISIPRIPVA
jgi:hypothetical protein